MVLFRCLFELLLALLGVHPLVCSPRIHHLQLAFSLNLFSLAVATDPANVELYARSTCASWERSSIWCQEAHRSSAGTNSKNSGVVASVLVLDCFAHDAGRVCVNRPWRKESVGRETWFPPRLH